MLKHSVNHFGSTEAPLQSPHHLTSSSHSGGELSQYHYQHQQNINDSIRYLSDQPLNQSHHHVHQHHGPNNKSQQHSFSHSILDSSYLPHLHQSQHIQNAFLGPSPILRKEADQSKRLNGSAYFSPTIPTVPVTPVNVGGGTEAGLRSSNSNNNTTTNTSGNSNGNCTTSGISPATLYRHGVLRSLSLLSVLSLLLALNSLIFLLKYMRPSSSVYFKNINDNDDHSPIEESGLLYEVTFCLTAVSVAINLCVLLVCSAQYFFAANGTPGTTNFLRKVTVIRGVAISGFFLSIPLFLCAIVLYTFTRLSFSLPAIVTFSCVCLAIIFGGCAMVHHVFTWQREKTKKLTLGQSGNTTVELSTLV